MKKTHFLICLMMIFMLTPILTQAATINVPTTENPTIQAGIIASSDGDIVLLADGTYYEYNIDFSGKSITVKSANGPDVCIVDCQGLGRGFLVYSGETVIFEGLTVKNGDTGDGYGDSGGAIYSNGSSVSIVNCIFESNSADRGGAVYLDVLSSGDFLECTFTDNSVSGFGGAVYSLSPTNFTDCVFTNNSAYSQGAIRARAATALFNCTFTGNSASHDVSAVACDESFTLTNCTFTNNSAYSKGAISFGVSSSGSLTYCDFTGNHVTHYGGAIYSFATHTSCDNCVFIDNSASFGGAVYCINSMSVVNCMFKANSANNYGGAFYFYLGSTSNLTNCTLTLNEAKYLQGGAIWCDIPLAPENPLTLKNCILWGNIAPEGSEIYEKEKPLVITYSNIQGGHTAGGIGNINTDPLFINADNDFHLQLSSPCIDTGTADGAPSDDLDGNYRPIGSGYDMGAYEFQGTVVIDSFTASPTLGKIPLAVNFECTAHDDTNTITGYQWNFDDGNTDTTLAGTIQYTYTIPGTFTATCTVVNDNSDQTTASTTIEVTNVIPIADAGSDQIIPGSSVELDGSNSNDPDGTISSWEWTLTHTENSSYNRSGSGEIVYLTDLEFGHYTVLLTVTDNFGAQGIDEMFLSIAGSTGNVYSQEDLDQVRLDGYNQGHCEGLYEGLNDSGNTIAGIIEETVEGDKVIEGPLIIKGCLIIM